MSLKIIDTIGDDNVATVYLAKTTTGRYLEFVESTPSNLLRKDKWVLVVSVLFGCPVGCLMCDAGSAFYGKLSKEEVFAQIDYLVNLRYPQKNIDCHELKIQFARMGEPTLNPALLDVLTELPERYKCAGLLPSLSTVAPAGCDTFLSQLILIKNRWYPNGKFQMQFSLHSTNQEQRAKIIPIKKWSFSKIADYGEKFRSDGDKKITLNFALAKNAHVCAEELKKYFSPEIFMVKITPVNPTINSIDNGIESYIVTGAADEDSCDLVAKLHDVGYEVIVSIGDLEENRIGSNCGQYVQKFISNQNIVLPKKSYTYAALKGSMAS